MPALPKGKIAGVQTRYVIVAVMGVVAFLVYRHFKGQQSTSAGSTSVPQPADAGLPAPQDSTGGGASGMGADPLANLADTLAAQTNALYSIGQTLQQQQPTTNTTTNNYYPSTGQPNSGGGNTSPLDILPQPTQPHTSFPGPPVQDYLTQTSAALDTAFGDNTTTQPLIGGTLTIPQFGTGGGGHLTNPVTPPPSTNYGGNTGLTQEQIRDRNRRQLQ